MSYIKVPGDIEKRSFEIIEEELGDKVKKFSAQELPIEKESYILPQILNMLI